MPCWQWTGRSFEQRSWRNAYAGVDALIACPGPSLAGAADLLAARPAGSLLLGTNTTFPAVRPDVWLGCDHPECYDPDLMGQAFAKFLGNGYAEKPWGGRRIKQFPNTHFLDRDKRAGVDLPTNAFVPRRLGTQPSFVWGWTFFTALHLAAWMGCRRIYLVGVDLNVELSDGDRRILRGGAFQEGPATADDAGRYCDDRRLDARTAQINRVGMAVCLDWLPKLREAGRKHGYELIVTGESSAARRSLPHVPLAEALERIGRRAGGQAMIPPPADPRVHGLLANHAQWGWPPDEPFGVMTGSDAATEWRLPWWLDRLRGHYDGPVTFADFGLSDAARQWCGDRGRVTDCRGTYLPGWFNKPVACTRADTQRTVWIDTDAEVLGPISPLKRMDVGPDGYAIAADGFNASDVGRDPVNTGVIVFEHGCPAVRTWARAALLDPSRCRGDQELLNRLIDDGQVPAPARLPSQWNALRLATRTPGDRIRHWTGAAGDERIRRASAGLPAEMRAGVRPPPRAIRLAGPASEAGWRGGEIVRRIDADGGREVRGVEVGVLCGRLSAYLLDHVETLHLTMVDRWAPAEAGSPYAASGDDNACRPADRFAEDMQNAIRATENSAGRRRIVHAESSAAAEQVEDGSQDFVFLDADHSYEGLAADLRAWGPKVRPGGWIGGHDWENPDYPDFGVRPAVLDYLNETIRSGRPLCRLDLGSDLTWFVRLPAATSTESTATADTQQSDRRMAVPA
ncbi:MAG TPA: class I SAM-dependent methyltransferase [Phycisphaerae bacterium]|nr:class I SAM-dependent methyltransferase [Phycisphaerae bacterium]